MLEFKNSIDSFEDLREQTWCCEFELDAIEKANKEDEFMSYLQCIFNDCDTLPTMTEINDYIRFDTSQIFEAMGLDKNGEEI